MGAADRQGVPDRRAAFDARRDHVESDRDPDDVGALHRRRHEPGAAAHHEAVRVAEGRVDAELRQLAAPAERALVDLVPEQHAALGARAEGDEDRQQVGRHVGPGRGLHLLQQVRGERRPHLEAVSDAGPAEPVRPVLDLDAELGEGAIEERKVRHRPVPHGDVAAGDRAQRQEGRDLVEVVLEGVFGATERLDAFDLEARAAAAGDARAHPAEEGAELLHVRLAGGIDEP